MLTSQTGRRRRCLRAGPAGSVRTPTTMRRSTFWYVRDFRACPFRPVGQGLLHGEGQSRGGPRRPVNEMGRLSSPTYKSHLVDGSAFQRVFPRVARHARRLVSPIGGRRSPTPRPNRCIGTTSARLPRWNGACGPLRARGRSHPLVPNPDRPRSRAMDPTENQSRLQDSATINTLSCVYRSVDVILSMLTSIILKGKEADMKIPEVPYQNRCICTGTTRAARRLEA